MRVGSAPTGAGKTYAFLKAAIDRRAKILFIVPTKRLAQNQAQALASDFVAQGFSEEQARQRVSIWTSDETRRRKEQNPKYHARIGRIDDLRTMSDLPFGKFVLATPEAVSFLLLKGAKERGETPFSLSDLAYFDHVVFDEFHTIDARGFGLAAAVCRLATMWRENVPRVTFLSATPIELRPVLHALDVEPSDIEVMKEAVVTGPRGQTESMRALHGDVSVVFASSQSGFIGLLNRFCDEVRTTLRGGRQVVLILDSVQDLFRNKEEIAEFCDRIGVPRERRLAINSWDDSENASFDVFFTIGRERDPLAFDVLVTTSSVEMGVTLRAGMIVMEPGHTASSAVQRVGRVARGDENGLVIVHTPGQVTERRPWLALALERLRFLGDVIPVETFVEAFLQEFGERFDGHPENELLAFDVLPKRAMWVSALFWVAMFKAWHLTYRQKDGLIESAPKQARLIASLLNDVERHGGPGGKLFVEGFLEEASRLRDIGESVRIVTSDGNVRHIPWMVYASYDGFSEGVHEYGSDGKLTVRIDSIDDALLSERRRALDLAHTRLPHTPLLYPVDIRRSPREQYLRRLSMDEKSSSVHRERKRALQAGRKIVSLTGLIPLARQPASSAGGAGVV